MKKIIQEDVVNWPDQVQDKIREPDFHLKTMLMIVKDTAVYVSIETKHGMVELDVVAEFQRRIYGGFAGSFPHTESWTLTIEEKKLLEIIREVKIAYPSLQLPYDSAGTSGKQSYWHFIDFADTASNEIIHTWIRESGSSYTTLALIGYSENSNNPFGDTKLINRDFWKVENDRRIQRFERLILRKLKERIK